MVPPLSGGEQKKPETRSWKLELCFTMRLGAQPHHHLCSPLKNFSLHLESWRAAFSSPV
ncbi:unnamed protein product [Staurois parvus]|uniref:Uncharacterized protein n=1 Tax=Staurois parvus TaxID=386267 RepID=A0ABN9G493_9NEOB|nr:unnamed protein product [Staurois parvus]